MKVSPMAQAAAVEYVTSYSVETGPRSYLAVATTQPCSQINNLSTCLSTAFT